MGVSDSGLAAKSFLFNMHAINLMNIDQLHHWRLVTPPVTPLALWGTLCEGLNLFKFDYFGSFRFSREVLLLWERVTQGNLWPRPPRAAHTVAFFTP